MRDYGKVSPKFWTSQTCKELRARGSEAPLVALYLMTSPMSNMLGLYCQPMLYIAHETGLGLEGASKGLQACIDSGYCKYDSASETVFVIEMASYQIAPSLKASDNRCAGIQKDYDGLPDNPFLGDFFDRYQNAFHLSSRRACKGASKPLPSQEQEQEQEKEQEQEQKEQKPKKARKEKPAAPLLTFPQFIEACRFSGEKPLSAEDPITKFTDDAGIPREYLRLAWKEFGRKHLDSGKKQADWRATFRNAVRGNWLKLWYEKDGDWVLTSSGVALQREMAAQQAAHAQQRPEAA